MHRKKEKDFKGRFQTEQSIIYSPLFIFSERTVRSFKVLTTNIKLDKRGKKKLYKNKTNKYCDRAMWITPEIFCSSGCGKFGEIISLSLIIYLFIACLIMLKKGIKVAAQATPNPLFSSISQIIQSFQIQFLHFKSPFSVKTEKTKFLFDVVIPYYISTVFQEEAAMLQLIKEDYFWTSNV